MSRKADAQPAAARSIDDAFAITIPAGARSAKSRLITRSEIHPDPEQPREDADADLRASIAAQGLLEPIIVRPHPSIHGQWMIVNGERRWRGCQGVLNDLPCIIRTDLDDAAARLAVQLVSNTGKPMTALQEARAFARMMTAGELTVGELARQLGRAPSTVAERLALLELGPWLPAIESGALPMSHAVKVLFPFRGLSDEIHAEIVEKLFGGDLSPDPDGYVETVDEFRQTVHHMFKPYLYPLTSSKQFGAPNPEFKTTRHDEECSCGRIKIALAHSNERAYCGNASWWKPLQREAQKAEKAKASRGAPASSSAAAKNRLFLPEGAKSVKDQYGQPPKGVVQLTSANGEWATMRDRAFDPADLVIDESKLVTWEYYGEYPVVGTRDLEAVNAACAKWRDRFANEVQPIRDEFGAQLRELAAAFSIDGTGVPFVFKLLEKVDGDLPITDVAIALGIEVPASILEETDSWDRDRLEREWAASLDSGTGARLLSGLAACEAEELQLPEQQLAALQQRALDGIRRRTIPWKKEPKAAKSKPSKQGKATAYLSALAVAGKQLSEETLEMPLGISSVVESAGQAEYVCLICECTDSRACKGGCKWWFRGSNGQEHVGVCSQCASDGPEASAIHHQWVLSELHAGNQVGRSAEEFLSKIRAERKRGPRSTALTPTSGTTDEDVWDGIEESDSSEWDVAEAGAGV